MVADGVRGHRKRAGARRRALDGPRAGMAWRPRAGAREPADGVWGHRKRAGAERRALDGPPGEFVIEIGCQTYSLRRLALREMLLAVRKAGFRCVELWAGHAVTWLRLALAHLQTS